jgi:peptidoglycan/xylan/chitin deacetylase (PgdA/CDA1 family)/GT2 family glycosyltransferase
MAGMSSVSIVIPARNAAATLNETIASVVRQTHAEWEIIVIDDGSTDSTTANARAWCDRDRRIRLIPGEQRGSSGARNEAARHAVSPWLLFLDADDLILPTHLATMLAAADAASQPVDLLYCGGAKMARDGRIDRAEMPPQQDHFKLLASRNLFYIHACLVRRSTFEKFGGFDETLKSCEEWDLWQRFARAGTVFVPVAESLTLYRLRASSLSHRAEILFRDASKVIKRGHGADPRVSDPLPAFAQGQPAQDAPLALVAFAAWCAGMLTGGGKDAEPFLERIEFPRIADREIGDIVSMMQGGVPVGACMLYEDWPALWPRHKSAIERVFTILQERCAIPDLAARCIAELETRLGYEFDPPQAADAAVTAAGAEGVSSPRRKAEPSDSPVLLMYHRVNTLDCDPWKLCVSPENLSQQLAMLTQERHVVPLSWLVEELKRGHVPSRAAVLTFDDGYADALFHAKPLLEQHSCPATFFLATGPIASRSGFWWDVLARIVLESTSLPAELMLEAGGQSYSWCLKGNGQGNGSGEAAEVTASELYFALWALVKPLRPDERQTIISSVAAWARTHADGLERDRILTAAEVRDLVDPAFIDIGAHTVSHPSLPSLSPAEQRLEIEESRAACEDLINALVPGFAYPFGNLDDVTCSEVSAAGFEFACTTQESAVLAPLDLMRLPRFYVGDWNAAEFENKILRRQ